MYFHFYSPREASVSPRKRSLSNLVNGSTVNMSHTALGGEYKNHDDYDLAFPCKVNYYGSIFIIIYVVLFNIGYWWICIDEYLQPAEKYITVSNTSSTWKKNWTWIHKTTILMIVIKINVNTNIFAINWVSVFSKFTLHDYITPSFKHQI